MAENKIPTILIAVAGVLLLLGMFLDVAAPTDDAVALCELDPTAEDCDAGVTLDEVVDKEGEEDGLPNVLVIVGLLLAVGAVLLLEFPALSDFEHFGNYLSIVSGVLGLYAAFILNGHFTDINDITQSAIGLDVLQYDIGGFAIVGGGVLGLIAGIYGVVAGRSE